MNKKGALFATATVLIVFLWIFGNMVVKINKENESSIKDVGLDTIDLIRQKTDSEYDKFFMLKGLEYRLNSALIDFSSENKGLNKDDFNEKFFEYLKKQEEFLEYDFNLVGDNLEFNFKGVEGSGTINNINQCQSEVVKLSQELLQQKCSYELGAKGPCNTGFDCSGLVKWVYVKSDSGVNSFPDGSWIQADWGRRNGLVVSNDIGKGAVLEVDKLEPGDVVFFRGSLSTDNYGEQLGIRHVAIYIGNGKIIEAAGKNTGIIESDITKKKDYRGAIRVCSNNFKERTGMFGSDLIYDYMIKQTGKVVTTEGLREIG